MYIIQFALMIIPRGPVGIDAVSMGVMAFHWIWGKPRSIPFVDPYMRHQDPIIV